MLAAFVFLICARTLPRWRQAKWKKVHEWQAKRAYLGQVYNHTIVNGSNCGPIFWYTHRKFTWDSRYIDSFVVDRHFELIGKCTRKRINDKNRCTHRPFAQNNPNQDKQQTRLEYTCTALWIFTKSSWLPIATKTSVSYLRRYGARLICCSCIINTPTCPISYSKPELAVPKSLSRKPAEQDETEVQSFRYQFQICVNELFLLKHPTILV